MMVSAFDARMGYATFILTLVISAVGMAFAATAQDNGERGVGHDQWHENFYQGLRRPGTTYSCCNLADCRPTSGRSVGDHYEVKINGAWVKVLPGKVLKTTAPDGAYHVCAPVIFSGKPEDVYCVVLPPEG